MAGTGSILITETFNGGREYRDRVFEDVADFTEATETLHAWLWLTQSQADAVRIIMTWMRGEFYSDHSVTVRYYVPGTVGHWFEIVYCS